jgi:hypothetical protein
MTLTHNAPTGQGGSAIVVVFGRVSGGAMPVFHHNIKQIHFKVVYYGPGLGGKTTNLKWIHANTRADLRGRLLSLNTETERTLFFDLLPIELGDFRGYSIRLHLCTVPGQIAYDRTRQLILRHVDGVVFVADSQESYLDSNIESVSNLQTNIELLGEDPTRLPLVVQYNKRDLPSAMAVADLHEMLNIPDGVPEIEAIARDGVGVPETMKQIVKQCLTLVGDPRQAPDGRSPSMLPGKRPSMFPGGRPTMQESEILSLEDESAGTEFVIPPSAPLPHIDPLPEDILDDESAFGPSPSPSQGPHESAYKVKLSRTA